MARSRCPPTATRRRCSRLVTSAGRDRPCGLQARDAAGDRNVRVAGGGETILEYLNAGLVDEFSITLSPVLFGSGTRLFDGVDATRIALDPVRTDPSPDGDPPDLRRPRPVEGYSQDKPETAGGSVSPGQRGCL